MKIAGHNPFMLIFADSFPCANEAHSLSPLQDMYRSDPLSSVWLLLLPTNPKMKDENCRDFSFPIVSASASPNASDTSDTATCR